MTDLRWRCEIEVRIDGETTALIRFAKRPDADDFDEDYDPHGTHVRHGTSRILDEARFLAWLIENGK